MILKGCLSGWFHFLVLDRKATHTQWPNSGTLKQVLFSSVVGLVATCCNYDIIWGVIFLWHHLLILGLFVCLITFNHWFVDNSVVRRIFDSGPGIRGQQIVFCKTSCAGLQSHSWPTLFPWRQKGTPLPWPIISVSSSDTMLALIGHMSRSSTWYRLVVTDIMDTFKNMPQ